MNRPFPFSRDESSVTPGGEAASSSEPVFAPPVRSNGFRADRALVGLAEVFTRRVVEPALGRKVWNGGLGEVVEQAVADSKISTALITPVDIARALGFLKPKGRR